VAEIAAAARERIRQGRGIGASKTKRERDKAELGLEVASHIPFTSVGGSCNGAGTWRGRPVIRVSIVWRGADTLRRSFPTARREPGAAHLMKTIASPLATNAVRPSGSSPVVWAGPEAPGGTGTGTGSVEDLREMALAQTYGVDLNQIKW
jgi:hypothetical protein